jgi:hypothetical protein
MSGIAGIKNRSPSTYDTRAVSGGASNAENPVLVFRPNGVAGGNVYTTEASLAAATQALEGPYTIFWDLSLNGSSTYTFTTVGLLDLAPGGTWTDIGDFYLIVFANETTIPALPIYITQGLRVIVTQTTSVFKGDTDNVLLVDLQANIQTSGAPFATMTSGGYLGVQMHDETYLFATGSNSIFVADTGSTVAAFVYDSAQIFSPNAVSSSGGSAYVFGYSPANFIVQGQYPILSISGLFIDYFGTGPTTIRAISDGGLMFVAEATPNVLYFSSGNGTDWIPLTMSGTTTLVNGVSPLIPAYVSATTRIVAGYTNLNGSAGIGTLAALTSDRVNGNPGSFRIRSLSPTGAVVATDQSTVEWHIANNTN